MKVCEQGFTGGRERDSLLVSRCFEPSQPQKIISGQKYSSHSAHMSLTHKIPFFPFDNCVIIFNITINTTNNFKERDDDDDDDTLLLKDTNLSTEQLVYKSARDCTYVITDQLVRHWEKMKKNTYQKKATIVDKIFKNSQLEVN